MNKEQLYELLRLDPYQVPGEVEYWALYAKSFYEDLFGKIDDPKKLKSLYQYVLKNKKLRNRDRDALTFFYYLRLDELEDPNFWNKVGKKNIKENMKAKLVKESLNEPVNEGLMTIAGGIILGVLGLKLLGVIAKKILGQVGMHVTLPPEKLKEVLGEIQKKVILEVGSGSAAIAITRLSKEIETKIDSGEITKLGQVKNQFENLVEDYQKEAEKEEVNWDPKKSRFQNRLQDLVKEEITPADQGFMAARKDNARGSRIVDYAIDLQNAITDLIEMGQLSEDELPEKDLQILMEANKIARKLEIKFGDEEHGITSVM